MAQFLHRTLVLGFATPNGGGAYGYYMSDRETDRRYAGPEHELREILGQYGEDGWEIVSMNSVVPPSGSGQTRITALALTKRA